MFRFLACALVVFTLATTAGAQSFVFLLNGAMVPCDHPLAIAEGLGCQPVAAPPVAPTDELLPLPAKPFRLGRSYYRASDGQRIYVSALGQLKGGWHVWLAECLNTAFLDPCPAVGKIWTIVANASAADWVEEP